jgi:serine/threonine protein kinase
LFIVFSSDTNCSTFLGTKYAQAPEMYNQEPYTRSVDFWGLGVVLYMLLMGQHPFSADVGGRAEMAQRVVKVRGYFKI